MKAINYSSYGTQENLKWAEQGKLKPVIAKVYTFENAMEAYKILGNGEKNTGKTVIVNN